MSFYLATPDNPKQIKRPFAGHVYENILYPLHKQDPIALFLIKQNLILILADRTIHSANDPLAKWDLLSLFNDSLVT